MAYPVHAIRRDIEVLEGLGLDPTRSCFDAGSSFEIKYRYIDDLKAVLTSLPRPCYGAINGYIK